VANKHPNVQAVEPVKEDRRRFLRRVGAGVALGSAGLVGCAAWFLIRGHDRLDPRVRRSMEAAQYTGEVVHTYPHDREAFTQGLVFEDGFLYEGTGIGPKSPRTGRKSPSTLRKVELESGRVVHHITLGEEYFGEGIAIVGNRIVQLTWQNKIGFVYDKRNFARLDQFDYEGEGWGLTYDGKYLILSDGSADGRLRFLDRETFKVVRELHVRDDGVEVAELNELEYIEGEIYANVWHYDAIARIDPRNGNVVGWIKLSALYPLQNRPGGREDALNGIAYDAKGKRLFVTGKNWPQLFEIRVVPTKT
jgi:glutamine cyclotransferase